MYDGKDKDISPQVNDSTKYISNTYGGVMQILEYVLEYLIDKRLREIDNYTHQL
jgi:hypothetical protein